MKQVAREMGSARNAVLAIHLAEVVLDGRRADVQLGGDFFVGGALRGKFGDPFLLRRQFASSIDGALPSLLASGMQFGFGAPCETLHAELGEELMGSS